MTATTFSYTSKGGIQRMADFHQAAQRHLKDADLLLQSSCFDNSCYHSGYSTECTIKLVLHLTRQPWRGHLLDLIPLVQGRAANYLNVQELKSMKVCAPIIGWSPEMRYDPDGLPHNQATDWFGEATILYSKTHTQLVANGEL